MFEGFTLSMIDIGEVTLRVRHGGTGPGLLLLHGHPQTHVMWHRVAPALARRFTLVMPDLRGYGGSSKPPSAEDHVPYAKRTMAADAIGLMEQLGFDRFAVVGHDRGARVAYRMALDHPDHVTKLAVLDIIPTGEMWRRMDRKLAMSYWHWLFLAQPSPLPERLIGTDPDAFYFRSDRAMFDPAALAEYLAAVHDAATVHAMCEDYRAGATVDAALDDADRAAGNRIRCPVLVLWSGRDRLADIDLIACWQEWADGVRGEAIDAGHFLAEEAPERVGAALMAFLRD